MNPDEIRRLHRQALALQQKGFAPDKINAWLAHQSEGQYGSFSDVQQAVQRLPDNLLRASAKLAQQGYSGSDIDKWVSANSQGQFDSMQALTEHLGAQRRAQNMRDNLPTTASGKAAAYAGGVANALMGMPTLGAMPQIRGVQAALDPLGGGSYQSPIENMKERYRGARNQAQQEAATFQGQNPASAYTSNVLSAPLGVLPFLASGATAAPVMAENAAGKVVLPWVQNTLKNAAMGGAIGDVAGLINGPNFNPGAPLSTNLANAVPGILHAGNQNAAVGGALGLLVPAVHAVARSGRNFAYQLARDPATINAEATRRIGNELNTISPNPETALAKVDEAVAAGAPKPVLADAGPNLGRLAVWAKNKSPILSNIVDALRLGRRSGRAPYLAGSAGKVSGLDAEAAAKGFATAQEHADAVVGSAADVRRVVGKQYDAVDLIEIPSTSPVAQTVKRLADLGREVSPMEAMVRNQNAKMGVGEPMVPPEHGDPAIAQTVNSVLESRGNQPMTVKLVRTIIGKLNDGAANAFAPGSRNTDLGTAYSNAAKELQTALTDPVNGVPEVAKLNAEYTKAKAVEQAYLQGYKAVDSPQPQAALKDLERIRSVAGQEGVDAHRYGGLQRMMEDAMATGENKAGMALARMQGIANPVRASNGGAGAGIQDAQRSLYEHFMGSPEAARKMDAAIMSQHNQNQTENLLGTGSRTAQETSDNAVGQFGETLSAASRGGGDWSRHAYVQNMLRWLQNPAERAIADRVGRELMGKEYTAEMRPQVVEWMMQQEAERLRMRNINQAVQLGGILAAPQTKVQSEQKGLLGRAANALLAP